MRTDPRPDEPTDDDALPLESSQPTDAGAELDPREAIARARAFELAW